MYCSLGEEWVAGSKPRFSSSISQASRNVAMAAPKIFSQDGEITLEDKQEANYLSLSLTIK